MAMISGMRLHMLPLHRLASGLRKVNSLLRPEKYSFIHIDSQVDEEVQPDIHKCVSNLLDGVPAGWEQDEVVSLHIENIMSSYRHASKSGLDGPGSQISNSPIGVLLGNEGVFLHEEAVDPKEMSVGSAGHSAGTCKPCAWNRQASGCFKGSACEFCHMCDEGAVKRKKKARTSRMKANRRTVKRAKQEEAEAIPATPRDWD